MVVNSPALQPQTVHTQIWPLIPMLINRTLEIVCFLMGHAFPLFSLMQMPLSLMALGVFIKVSECTAVHPAAPPLSAAAADAALAAAVAAAGTPRPFCSAPIILAAILMVIEIVIFLLVLFITQTHREHQIMMLTHRIMDADIEAGRGFRDHAHVQPVSPVMPESTIKYCTVVQPCGQAIMVAVPEQVLPTPPIQPSTQPHPRTPYPGDSPQRPSPIYPPTALQLSLMESESRVAAAAVQSGGNGQGSEVTSAGLPEAAAAAPPAAEAAGPTARARRVIQIDVDATSSGKAAALVHWHAEDGSRQSTPVQVHVSWSPVASPQHALRDTTGSGSGLSSDKDAGRADQLE
ncbi:hypothetical protein COCSUDRAFT_62953 [Coccomyxa subellipsoidea C-169]|uniref:Uncharacterized protein n=1 Tax=Coccomyxa subellipsoidea (strain C-169) TaxID=574566 RepID=I0YYE9_COCSC|nr:hypothetical protein COCSUDRAFT_62953 [Coccomyxa subellipsoidea C-169]EIE23418.1 hypothetical protein COCSUDRAFT_62953 [Coccomyxa subellipsoidea C-169]|eukprot:XP_005647962.1 hypothetical protein COCSUDRAFT_62953 [Coccomyxa subellipsoidea C-169]